MSDSFELIKDKQVEMQPLFKRMDKDRDLLNMVEFKLKGAEGKPLKDGVNVTMNDAKVFADEIKVENIYAICQIGFVFVSLVIRNMILSVCVS